jgi:glycosyltransferase AglI
LNKNDHGSLTVSMVIPVRDDWTPLLRCLDSVESQTTYPAEVIVVDDGSYAPPPPSLAASKWPFRFRVIRRPRINVAAARNAGVSQCNGDLICFVDADMVLDRQFLSRLMEAAANHPADVAFQPKIVGGSGNAVERMEDLRLVPTQEALQRPDGHISYFVTGACAIRSSFVAQTRELFDATVVRGSDTLLFARLLRGGHVPRYVPAAVASHRPPHSALVHVLRHFGMGYHTVRARAELAESGDVMMSSAQRLGGWIHLLARARQPADQLAACLALTAYGVQVTGRIVGRLRASFERTHSFRL